MSRYCDEVWTVPGEFNTFEDLQTYLEQYDFAEYNGKIPIIIRVKILKKSNFDYRDAEGYSSCSFIHEEDRIC